LREGFRSFRPDRIVCCTVSGECFDEQPGRDLDAYLRSAGGSCVGME
jgi:predicted DNA-binding transcriptional regulator YafY